MSFARPCSPWLTDGVNARRRRTAVSRIPSPASIDAGGNRLTLSLDGTLFVSYAYDDASRLTTITRGTNNFTFGYDNANRRTSLGYPNGVNTAYTYDNLNRVLGIAATNGVLPIASSTYTYDPAGNRLTKAHLEYTETYKYDKLYRLTEVDRAIQLKRQRYAYDAVGNRVSEQVDNSVTSSSYNSLNQLLSTTGGGTMRWRGTLNEPGNVSFTSATVNGKPARMLQGNVFEADIPVTAGSNAVTLVAKDVSNNATTKNYTVNVSGTGATYTYDLNGNLATKTEGSTTSTYEWTAEDQLKRVLNNGTEVARFAYDPLGRRVEKVAGGVTTTWTYDGLGILREAGATTTKYVHGPWADEPLAHEDSVGTLTYVHADALGSVVKTSSTLGVISGTKQYDAWGNIELGASTSGYAFAGREWDHESGLHYYRARYYDSKIGRFTSEDPIRFNGGRNFYRYVSNNPVAWTDPLGLAVQVCRRTAENAALFQHGMLCVSSHSGTVCGGQVPRDELPPHKTIFPPVPSTAQVRTGSEGMTCQTRPDEPNQACFQKCVRKKITSRRRPPYSALGLGGENCWTWIDTVIITCSLECKPGGACGMGGELCVPAVY